MSNCKNECGACDGESCKEPTQLGELLKNMLTDRILNDPQDQHLRLRCLELAVSDPNGFGDRIALANDYYNFVTNNQEDAKS